MSRQTSMVMRCEKLGVNHATTAAVNTKDLKEIK